jgi:glucose-6-phosphate dehydrogenase assembly protein OpcA
MATTYKVLGQNNPSATTATTLYTVPSSTEAVVSTIVVANQAGTSGTYRLAIRPDGESLAAKHYLAYDVALPANSTHTYTIGVTLNAADVITVYASSTSMSFNVFGSEIA